MDEKPLNIGGKTYISAKRAGQLFGYTPDYIGQLARAGKIESKMVGRSRFVDYTSLVVYSQEIKLAEQAQEELYNSNRLQELQTEDKHSVVAKPAPEPVPISTIPEMSSQAVATLHPSFIRTSEIAGLVAVLVVALMTPIGMGVVRDMTHQVYDSSEVNKQVAYTQDDLYQKATALSSVNSVAKKADDVYLGVIGKIDDAIVAAWRGVRSVVLAVLSPIIGSQTSDRVVVETATTTAPVVASTGLYATTTISLDQVKAIAEQVANEQIAKTIDYASLASKNSLGVVTVPSSGTPAGDEALKQAIKNSFSDQVNVTLDSSKGSGVIQPVFRNPTDDKYLFVVVPVKQIP